MKLASKTYLINLSHREDRRKISFAQMQKAGIDFQHFPAIDARKMKVRGESIENPGLIGCFLSHYFILQEALLNGYDSVAVFEDDVILVSEFQEKFQRAQAELPETWELFMLGYYERLGDKGYKIKISDNIVIPRSTWGTHGYIVRREGIKKMWEGLQVIKTHIDVQISTDIVPKTYTYCAYPALCHQSGIKSDIK